MRWLTTHPGLQRAFILCCLSLSMGSLAGSVRAESGAGSNDSTGSTSEQPTTLGEVLQAGARLMGRGSRSEAAPHELQEAELKGTSSNAAKKAALAAMPLEQLSPEQRAKATSLLRSASFYRRLPKVTFAIEPEVYSYFIAHPDVAVSIWRAMKISKLQMWQTGRYDYEADAGDGSTGQLEVLHSGPEKHLVTCDGLYKSPLFSRPIEANSLLLLQTSFFREVDGTVYVTHRADLFVTFPSQTVDVVSKIFSPLAVAMTDRTFAEISLFLKMMSMAMSRRPDWVESIAGKMDGVAEIRKDQIRELTTQVFTAAQKRTLDRISENDGNPPGARTSGRGDSLRRLEPVPLATGTSPGASASDRPGTARVISSEKRAGEPR